MRPTEGIPDHRRTARSACSLALALIQGRSVTSTDFEVKYRCDPTPEDAPRKSGARRSAFKNACSYLEDCGFVLERGGTRDARPGCVRLDREATLAPVEALSILDGEPELLEDLGHLLVASADAFEGVNSVEAHGAAAKLLRDFALNGLRRELAPASTRDQRTIRDAMTTDVRVMVRYEREDGTEIRRVLEPLRHVSVDGRDFLVAVDTLDDAVKTFHYERFLEVKALEESFEPRELDLGNLFHPPFGYVNDPDRVPIPAEVVFSVPDDRMRAVRAELARLLCSGSGTWERVAGSGGSENREGFRWTVPGEDPIRAASFALSLGIEVLAPSTYRDAYLTAISDARRVFGLGDEDEGGERA